MRNHHESSCPYCLKKFQSAGPFDNHLRAAHAKHAKSFYDDRLRRCRRFQSFEKSEDNELPYVPVETDRLPDFLLPEEIITLDSDAESEFDGADDYIEESQATRRELYEGSGKTYGCILKNDQSLLNLVENPFHPFRNPSEFKLARFFVEANVPWEHMESFMKANLAPSEVIFTSAFTLRALFNNMENSLGPESWRQGEVALSGTNTAFYYRDPIDCVKYLIRQRAYESDMVFSPERLYEGSERQYGELHTADWWWDTQVCTNFSIWPGRKLTRLQETLPEGATIVPIICASDTTHLTNFSGDKKAWPIYLTIGNIKSTTRNKPTAMALMLLALLPVPPKLKDCRNSIVSAENNAVIHRVLATILGSLVEPGKSGMTMDCADGKQRDCFPILCGWIADHMEHVLLHNLKNNACPRCEVLPEELGRPPSWLFSTPPPTRNHRRYRQLAEQYQNSGETRPIEVLAEKGIKGLFNAFWILPRVDPAELPKPDLLHTIYLGMLKHLMEWIQDFLKKHGRLDNFDKAWSSLGSYPGLNVSTKAYREVSQWQGKEMRTLGRVVLPAFTAALRAPTEVQRFPFRAAIRCVVALVDFHLLAQYKTHTESTLRYMHDSLETFHKEKGIFLEFRVGKRAKKGIERSVAELTSQQAMETLAKTVSGESAAKRRRIAVKQREELAAAKEDEAVEKAHFNFIKMHLLEHFGSTVRRFGSIPLFSTDISELAHKTQIKESYRRSNKNNPAVQILDNYSRVHAFKMHSLNLKAAIAKARSTLPEAAIALELEEILGETNMNSPGTTTHIPSTPPKRLMRSPDKTSQSIQDMAVVLGIPELAACILRFAKNNNLTTLERLLKGDSDPCNLLAERFKMLQIPVPVFQDPDSYINHNIRCTSSESFRGAASRNDAVWVSVGEDVKTGDLGGKIPGYLRGLLKLRENVTASHRIAIVEVLWPMNGGIADPCDTLVRVQRKVYKTPGGGLWVTNIRSILGMAHLVPYGENRWLVNNRVDLKTWNDVYMGLRDTA